MKFKDMVSDMFWAMILKKADKNHCGILSEQCKYMHCVQVIITQEVLDYDDHQIHPMTGKCLAECAIRVSFNHLFTMLVSGQTSSVKIALSSTNSGLQIEKIFQVPQ